MYALERAGFEVVAQCETGPEAVERIRALRPDAALLDHRMPGLTAAEVIEQLRLAGTAVPVLVLSALDDADVVARSLAAGAAGFLTKAADREVICRALERVARGETVIGDDVQAGVVTALRDAVAAGRPALSERERQILELLADGLSVERIAGRLYVSAGTVKSHLQSLYAKLGVSERAAAVAEGMRCGLIR